MAALIRAGQWRVTPLGAIESWPQTLKTAVEIMLQSRQPAYVCWGRALITLYNDATVSVLGSRHPHALGRPYPEVFPEAWDDLKPVIDAAFEGEAQHIVGQRIARGGDQPVAWSSFTWTPLRDDKGKVAGLYCVATETALQIGDEQLRTVIENARDAVSMLDLVTGKYVFLSPSHAALTGFTAEELKDFTPADFVARLHPDDVARVRHPVHSEDDGFGGTIEYRWKVKSGEYRWFSVSRKLVHDPNGQPAALVSINRDITERKTAELQVQASQATLAAALESMTDALYITDAEGRFLQVNSSFATFHRYKSVQECASNFDDFAKDFDFLDGRPAPPEDRPVPRALRGESATDAEYRLTRRETGESWAGSYSFGPIRDHNGVITGAVVAARDITKTREAAEELRRSEARLALAIDSADLGTWEWDLQSDTVIRSTKIYELLGIDPLTGADDANTFWRMVDPEDLKRVLDALERLKSSGRDWRDEFRVYRPDGSVRWIAAVGRLVRDADGTPRTMYGVNYDITEQKTAEAKIRQSEARTQSLKEQLMHVGRISELSQVSAGIAHELNQPLAAMLNYSATAKRLIAKKDQTAFEAAAKAITQAGTQAMRAAEIIRRMRDFVEKRAPKRAPDDINAIVREAAELGLIGAKADGIEIDFHLEPGLPAVTADRVQIEQVLINLMHNAMDAMAAAPVRHLTLATRRNRQAIEVIVTDTGHGIPDHLADMLFQPFVTTKETGMGIGLAISREIIKAHDGEIAASSHEGLTTFRFSLPL
jgi:PAS domain S-box-containing protein